MDYQFRLANWNEDDSPTRDRDARTLRYLLASNSSSSIDFNNRTGSTGTNNQVMHDNIMQNNPLHPNTTNTTTSHDTNNNHHPSPMVHPTTININNYNYNQTSPSSESSPVRLFGSSLTLPPTTRRNTTRPPSSMYPSITQLGIPPSNYHQVPSRERNNTNGSSTGIGNTSFKRSRSPDFVRGESSNQGSQEDGVLRRRTNPPPSTFQLESVSDNNMSSMPSTSLSTRFNNNTTRILRQQVNQSSVSATQSSLRINRHPAHAGPAGFFDDTPSYNSPNQSIINADVSRFLFPYQQETHRANFTMLRRTELAYASTFLASLYPSTMTIVSTSSSSSGSLGGGFNGLPPSNSSTSSYRLNPHPPPPRQAFSIDVEFNQYMQMGTSLARSGNLRLGNNRILTSTSPELRAQRNMLRDQDLLILDYSIILNVLDSEELTNMLHNIDNWPYEMISPFEEDVERIERGPIEEDILAYIETESHVSNPNETNTQKKVCTICQEDYVEGEIIGRLDCRHIYHLECIKQWLLLKNACPICKQRALEVDEDEDESD